MTAAKTRPKTAAKKRANQPAAKKKTAKSSFAKTSAPAKKVASAEKTGPGKAGKKTAAAARTAPKKSALIKSRKPEISSKDRLRELRKNLLNKKETILKEAQEEISRYVSGENRQMVDTALDDGDYAQVDITEDVNLQRLSAHRKLLHGIDEAIRKIAEGTYGICEECGEQISEKRLQVLPAATLCIDCQENKEQFEALETPE
jgi:DnaK suppressor protein